MTSKDAIEKINRIEAVCGLDIGGRQGIQPVAEYARGGLLAAARSLADHPRPHIGIISGYFVAKATPPNCETDGPPGAVHLASAFHRAGIPCRIVTDTPNANTMVAAAWGAGLPSDFPIDFVSMDDEGRDGGVPLGDVIAVWRSMSPPISHVISLERAGPAKDGRPHMSNGDDMSAFTAPLEKIFSDNHWTSIGVGDGGNELGMGKLPRDLVEKYLVPGERYSCVVGCDHLIVHGVCNWAAYSLLAALALLRPELRAPLAAGLTRETDHRILGAAVKKGFAVSYEKWGGRRVPCMCVDGLPWEVHADKLEEVVRIFNS